MTSDLIAIRRRVESAAENPGDKQINDAISAAAYVILASTDHFGEKGEGIPATAKKAVEAFFAVLERAGEQESPDKLKELERQRDLEELAEERQGELDAEREPPASR